MTSRPLNWVNITFLVAAHILAVFGVVHMIMYFNWATLALGFLWLTFGSLSISGGYHRLFGHRAYKAHWSIRLFYCLFGAASVQNSVLNWASDHRVHHNSTDEENDPYNIKKGFWWAHVGWVLFKDEPNDFKNVPDLMADPIIRFQHKYYVPLAAFVGFFLPGLIAACWGDFLGGLLVAGFMRVVFQYQATFSINSVAHCIGTQPYSKANSARDSWITAFVSLGEGYHNYHHRFPTDYRNGVRAYHFDPTKWFVWTMSKIGFTKDLRRVPDQVIAKAKETVSESRAALADHANFDDMSLDNASTG